MADKTCTQLTELTLGDKSDIMYIVDDPAGTPLSRKITVENVLQTTNTLDANTSVLYTDIALVVDDPAGTPSAQKCTTQNLVKGGASQGACSAIIDANLTVSRATVTDASGKLVAATTTAAEIGYVNGVTGAIQTQFTGKMNTWVSVPANAGAAGTAGQLAYAAGFLYICVATNTWQRVVIATW